jgi:hypothetical protein
MPFQVCPDFQQLYHRARLPHILQTYILGHGMDERLSLLKIHLLLDISWADLRAAICPLGHIIDSEEVSKLNGRQLVFHLLPVHIKSRGGNRW